MTTRHPSGGGHGHPIATPPAPDAGFADLGLSADALLTLDKAGFVTPTPIQVQAIPPALAGRDVIGCAATGTGKTAAFLLPIIERVIGKRGTRVLILAPTRELVLQIADHLEMFGRSRGVSCVSVLGGLGMDPQVRGLREGRNFVIATPGRLIDHLERGNARLDEVEFLVLDEADRMLDMGFKPQLDRILAKLPRQRQTMLFSATMAGEVAQFAKACLRDPVRVEIVKTGTVAARVEQGVYFVPQASKADLLLALLSRDDATTLVFTRTKHRADRVAKALHRAGIRSDRIHGNRSQGQRQAALDGFKGGRIRVLVATDIAARGIDVEDIGHVVNFDLSRNPEDHVHRVGRTARAAASGRASSFCSSEETGQLRAIERFTRTSIPKMELPGDLASFKAPPPPPAYHPDSGLVPVAAETPPEPPSHGERRSHGGHPAQHTQRGRRHVPWHLRDTRRGRNHDGASAPRQR